MGEWKDARLLSFRHCVGSCSRWREVWQESPSFAGAKSLESKLRHVVVVDEAGREFLRVTAGSSAVTDGLRKSRFSWPTYVFTHQPTVERPP